MPNLTRLNTEDYMAVTRAMDANRNNRIDKTEANVTWGAHTQIGNSNGVAGTRETADALAKGDVFISALQPAAADKVADYFSKRNENFNKPVAEWISDAWISKEDFDFDADTRRALDTNADNRISTREFSAALVSGALTIGASRQVSQDPFSKPAPRPTSQDPFAKPSAPSNDPFAKPSAPSQDPFARPAGPSHSSDPFSKPSNGMKPATGAGHDPFAKPATPSHSADPFSKPSSHIPDSGAYVQLEMLSMIRSDFEKSQILGSVAQKTNLSPREQVMLADAALTLSSDFSRAQILQTMAGSRNLSEAGQIQVAKNARQLSSDFSRGQLVTALITNHKLGYAAQESVINTIGTLSGDFSKTQQYIAMAQNQQLHPENKALILRQATEKVSSDFSKRQIMEALF